MPRPVCAALLAAVLACQPIDRSAGDADTTAAVHEPPPADSIAAPSGAGAPDTALATPTAGAPVAAPPAAAAPDTAPDAGVSPQLLVPGDHYSGGVHTVTGETWLGLFRSDTAWTLRATDVTVVAIPNPCVDTGSQKTGRRVGVDRSGKPLFLVRHAPSLEPRAAHAVLTGPVRLYPGERREVELGSPAVRWAIAAYGSAPAPRAGGAGQDAIREYSLVVSRAPWTAWQPLFTFRAPASGAGLRAPPALLWAGDMSGDGNLDVFVDLTTGDRPGPIALYVSTTGGSELLEKVAEYQPGKCEQGGERPGSPIADTAVTSATPPASIEHEASVRAGARPRLAGRRS